MQLNSIIVAPRSLSGYNAKARTAIARAVAFCGNRHRVIVVIHQRNKTPRPALELRPTTSHQPPATN